MQASKYLDGAVKPWEWGEQPAFWLEATLAAMSAEQKAREYQAKKDERKAARARGRKGRGI